VRETGAMESDEVCDSTSAPSIARTQKHTHKSVRDTGIERAMLVLSSYGVSVISVSEREEVSYFEFRSPPLPFL